MAKFTFSTTSSFAASASLVGSNSNDTLSFETATSAITISDTLFSGLTQRVEALVLPSFSTNRATLGEEAEAAGFSSIYGGAQADFISAAGYTSGINIYDLAGLNTLIGGEGNDRIIGSSSDANSLLGNGGNDTMEGGSGKDTLNGGTGADRMSGKGGNDFYIVDNSGDVVVESLDGGVDSVLAKVSDYTLAGNTEWLTLDSTIESGTGNSLANTLVGNSAANTLNGGIGNDSMVGLGGNDYYIVDSLTDMVVEAAAGGTDSVEARVTGYTLAGNAETLILGNTIASGFGNSLANILLGNSLANTLSGGIGSDTMDGGAGNDFYIVDSLLDKVVETLSLSGIPSLNGGIDSVLAQVSGYTLAGNTEYLILGNGVGSGFGNSLNNTLLGNSIANTLIGDDGNDTIDGGAGNDTLIGGADADSLIGGAGADFYIIDNLGDKVFESLSGDIDTVISSVDFTLSANVERLTLTGNDTLKGIGNSLANTLVGNSASNTLDGGLGNDSLVGGTGNDYYIVDSLTDIVVEGASAGADSVFSNITNYVLASNVEALILSGATASGTGNSLNNTLIGNSAANSLSGEAGNDWLDAGAGSDWLNGGTGNDTMDGGTGNDYYIVDSLTDLVVESLGSSNIAALNGGIDSVVANVNGYTLTANTEWLILDAAIATGIGNSLGNTLIGNFLSNTLNGGEGVDSMVGSFGNDYYIVDEATDKVIENIGGGTDSVLANVTGGYTLAGNTEWLILGSQATSATGNSLGNTLIGNDSANTLDGGAGADSLAGGKGHDVYILTDSENAIFETADGGVDTVISSASFTLGLNLENLILTGTAVAAFGNSLANTIIGNSTANTLDGGGGADSLLGGAGNDYYIIDSLTDEVIEGSLSGGTDSVFSKITGYTLDEYAETLILGNSVAAGTGNSLANTLIGNSAANTLDGGTGVDSLIGLGGNDYYIIDTLSDKVFEQANAGIDSVLSQITDYTLAGNTEWLLLASTIESGTGNSLANTLIGNSAANTLNGGLGNDSLAGLAGDDYYIVDSLSDFVFESLNGGMDSVIANVSGYTLSGNVEWLRLDSTIAAGTGNALANTLIGNSAANTLDGGAGNDSIDGGAGNDWLNGGLGNDTLVGGLGNDYYIIDSLTDVVLESSSLGGNDSVFSTVNHTLNDNFEVLILSGTATSGTGNSLANTLLGNSLSNTLDGGLGNDSLVGSTGNDYFIIDTLSDKVFEAVNAGIDSVLALITNYTLAANTEWLRLDTGVAKGTGNSLANTLVGNESANTLDGGVGNDSLAGLAGDDFYIVDSLSDVVFESLNGGIDSVVASVSGYTLSGNVEWLRLDSTIGAGIGNSLANTLIGNSAANTLDGGTGNDSLVGLAGNDYYIIDSLSDEVIESTLSGGGTDSVLSKVSGYTLEDNTEVLILAGTVGVGTGNSLANTLIGNSVANTLDGGLGNDSLVGLAGNDYYKINSLTDIVVEAANGGIDSVLANVSNYTLAGNAEWLILDSTIASGTGNSLANTLLGNAEDNTLNGGLGSDSLIGDAGDDYYILDNTSDAILENSGAGIDSVLANLSVYTLAGNTEVLIMGTGTTGIGNILDNTLIGNSLSNLLTGNTGDDSLFGFSGDDNLMGCNSLATGGKGEKDTLTGGIGSDIFNLGSALGVFYNDGVAGNSGEDDFAFITDFTVGKDILKLKGTALQYSLGDHTVAGLTPYKGLYYETGATDELIAIIQPASGTLDITSLMANAQFV